MVVALLAPSGFSPVLPAQRSHLPSELVQAGRLIESGSFEGALRLLQNRLARNPADAQALFLKGMALSGLERWPEAYSSFGKALRISPGFQPALRGRGIAAYNVGHYSEATATLTRYLASSPEDESARLYLGRSHLRSKGFSQAAKVLESLTGLRRIDPWIDVDLAEALQGAGRTSEAAPTLLRITSDDPHLVFRVGSLLFELERYQEAAGRFRSIADRYPDPVAIGYNLALAYFRSGRLDAAEAELKRLIQSGVRDGDVFNLLASVFRETKRVREAYEAFQEAVRAAPEEKVHYVDLLSLCIEMENYEEGLKLADLALARHPRVPELYFQRAILYSFRNQFKLAERDFRQALALSPRNEGLAIGLAVALISDDRLEEARRLLGDLVKSSQQYLAWYLYADVLIRSGVAPGSPQERLALQALDNALRINPAHADSRLARARLLKARGRPDEAAAELQRAIEADPDHRASYYELYRLKLASGNREEAEKLRSHLEELSKKAVQESWQQAVLRQQMMLHTQRPLAENRTSR